MLITFDIYLEAVFYLFNKRKIFNFYHEQMRRQTLSSIPQTL